ncbi:MAG TPA: SDR family NAD(P)-dependent oxidoreductase [Bauldia sp.]|nr:SDR family NAD(P)-dependent oxidoreductase [Bauldia sp.]
MSDYPFDYDFTGKAAVITGGARGFGLSFARALASLGATVVLGDVNADAGEGAAASIRSEGGKARFARLDVRRPEDAAAAVALAVDMAGRLDIWINNAGIARHGRSETLTADAWAMPVDIMLSGTFYGAQAAGRHMLVAGGGTIINIASVNGLVAQSGRASYASAKAGVIRLTEVLAGEWAHRGVRVNAIAPAVFMTDLARTSFADGSASPEVYLRRSPSGRMGEPPELVAAMLFLASPHASYITGQTLKVDGAWTADLFL